MDGGMQVLAAVSLARTFTFVKSPPWLQRRFIGKKSLDEFLFEDLPRYGNLLSIWAGVGAVWFLWLDYLCWTRYRC